MRKIYLSSPCMSGEEQKYIKEAFDTNWVAPLGNNVIEFEKTVREYIDVPASVAMTTGTAAIHTALRLLDVTCGDIVFCQSMTFCASANPIVYQNATPVFIDSEPDTWNMSPDALREAFKKYPNPKAVIIVHLYGTPAKMDEIMEICAEHNTVVIEDAAESLGATYKGKKLGSFGEYGILSFNGNKMITTSGGGMLLGKNQNNMKKALKLITQAREDARWYQHEEIGYNYRMSNISAGIGRGQMTALADHIAQKTAIYKRYKEAFLNVPLSMQPYEKCAVPNHWLSVATVSKDSDISPLVIMDKLLEENVETRPAWKPMHLQPVFKECDFIPYILDGKSVSEDLFARGICLPSDFSPNMTVDEQNEIIELIKELF